MIIFFTVVHRVLEDDKLSSSKKCQQVTGSCTCNIPLIATDSQQGVGTWGLQLQRWAADQKDARIKNFCKEEFTCTICTINMTRWSGQLRTTRTDWYIKYCTWSSRLYEESNNNIALSTRRMLLKATKSWWFHYYAAMPWRCLAITEMMGCKKKILLLLIIMIIIIAIVHED